MNGSRDSLAVGARIGPYEVLSELGAGGMGRVYLARDTKLERKVAIKALPPEFASSADRLARFQREAKFLAALNHPNIGSIFGLEASGDGEYLVLEFVPGESLAHRLEKGPLSVDESLEICRQVALALEAAHEAGLVHRDLKPANVMVTPDGAVKVLDFGLAKADRLPSGPGSGPARSPTPSLTGAGMITGTAGYMSPEQVRGKRLDKRTDVWSFGCVLYECLTGRLAFGGESAVDRLSAILEKEPDWSFLPEGTSPRVLDLLQRCLVKDPKARLRDIGDARLEIEAALAGKAWKSGSPSGAMGRKRPLTMRLAPWLGLAGAVLLGAAGMWAHSRFHAPPPPGPIHLEMSLPASAPLQVDAWEFCDVAISPDGSTVVYAGTGPGGIWQLYQRGFDDPRVKAIPGTQNGVAPFFSPDGRWLAFLAVEGDRLMKIPMGGGAPTLVTDNYIGSSGVWASDGIYFTNRLPLAGHPRGSIFRTAPEGGSPQWILAPDRASGQTSLHFRQWLPGARAMLLGIRPGGAEVYTPSDGRRTKVLASGQRCRYVPTGHLVTMENGALLSIPFDPRRAKVTGAPLTVLEGLSGYSLSDDGTLAWLPVSTSEGPQSSLVWVDRRGNARPLTGDADSLGIPRISPNGRWVAVQRYREGINKIWIFDRERGTFGVLAPGPADPETEGRDETCPVWSPAGDRIAYSPIQTQGSASGGAMGVCSAPFAGGGPPVWIAKGFLWPECYSPDGRWLALGRLRKDQASGWDQEIWLVPATGQGEPRPLVASPSSVARNARISPDGRWIAYFSDESGRFEVYVQSFPEPGNKVQVSAVGGIQPLWSGSGREIFYMNGDKVMAVPVRLSPSFEAGAPEVLFAHKFLGSVFEPPWDAAPDGQHFVMIQENEATLPAQINIVLNFFEELKQKVPRSR